MKLPYFVEVVAFAEPAPIAAGGASVLAGCGLAGRCGNAELAGSRIQFANRFARKATMPSRFEEQQMIDELGPAQLAELGT